jgi:hypothetical protein
MSAVERKWPEARIRSSTGRIVGSKARLLAATKVPIVPRTGRPWTTSATQAPSEPGISYMAL